ncbi:MAG: TonB-dependent receptor [Bacteroidia bacterium]
MMTRICTGIFPTLLTIGLMLILLPAPAQTTTTLSGYVRDAETGEAMIGATVFVPGVQRGTYTNAYGFYSFTLLPGSYAVQYRYTGYATDTLVLDLGGSLRHDVELRPQVSSLEEVVISSHSAGEQVASTEMGVASLSIEEIRKLPVFMGETDILKSIQLLPGVKPAGEGSSGYYVRGGGTDQNLILLDEAPVYQASHLLGFFSVFNGDAIRSTRLYKGNMPAEYGGRLSSTLDVRMKEGNNKDYHVSGGIGLIASRLLVEGPIVEDQGSFMVSGRRTYADLFLGLSPDSNLSNSQLYFYDLNAKANYRLGERDQLFVSGYFGRDVFGFQDEFGIDWGNTTATLRWNHLFSDKLFLNSTLIYSDFDYAVNLNSADIAVTSGIRDFNWKEDLSYYHSDRHTFQFGVNAIYHTFAPGIVTRSDTVAAGAQDRCALETAAYASHDWRVSNRLKVNYGLRYSSFTALGPGTFYRYDAEGLATDSTTYSSGDIVTTYGGLEPRITATWLVGDNQSVKASYARNRQYVHLLTNGTGGTPTDVWLPSSEIVEPEIADQIALGYFLNLADNTWEASVEVYYKDLQNQIEYRNNAALVVNDAVESQLTFGEGQAYGAEFLLRKTQGKLTGWVSYTLSRTWRMFDEIDGGERFPARQDRIHDLSLVLVYDPNPRWSFSGSWVYYTGDAITYPSGSYLVDGRITLLYTTRNGYRMPDYHRLDLSATWYSENPRSSLNVSLYNAYGRKNAYTIDLRVSEEQPASIEAVKTYLFQWVPSVTWNFAF